MGFGLDTSGGIIKSFIFEEAVAQYAAVMKGAGGMGYAKLPASAGDIFLGISQYGVDSEGMRLPCPVLVDGGITYIKAGAAFSAGDFLKIADTSGRLGAIAKITAVQTDHITTFNNNVGQLSKTARGIISINVAAGSGATGPFRQTVAGAVAANTRALGFVADALLAVYVTAGGVTGKCNILPAGVSPAASHDCALNAGRTSINFLGADAVTAATYDCLRSDFSRVGQFQVGTRGGTAGVGVGCLASDGTSVSFNAADGVSDVYVEYLIVDPVQNVVAIALGDAAAANDLVPALIVRGQVSGLT